MKKENTHTLETSRLILRKFEKSDVDDILLIYSDKDVNKFLPWFPIATYAEAKDYLEGKILPQYDMKIAYSYAVVLKETNRVIGYVHIADIGGANDIGYGIDKVCWNKGYAFEAVSGVIMHLKEVNFPFLTATHDIENPNSGFVMKKVGMKYCYTYVDLWQPKNYLVTFRMYQINFDENKNRLLKKYWDISEKHYVEDLEK